jgi:hypothetical protein
VQIDQLVAELLSRGDMNDDTTLELNRILEDWRGGKLDPDDESYVRAFHARIVSGAVSEPIDEPAAPAAATLDGLSIEDWRDRALKAEAELAEIKDAAPSA